MKAKPADVGLRPAEVLVVLLAVQATSAALPSIGAVTARARLASPLANTALPAQRPKARADGRIAAVLVRAAVLAALAVEAAPPGVSKPPALKGALGPVRAGLVAAAVGMTAYAEPRPAGAKTGQALEATPAAGPQPTAALKAACQDRRRLVASGGTALVLQAPTSGRQEAKSVAAGLDEASQGTREAAATAVDPSVPAAAGPNLAETDIDVRIP